jgi:hypothetical protein
MVVLVPVHVDCDASVCPLKPNPRTFATLLGGILGHVFVLLKNLVNAVVGDTDVVSDSQDVSDGHCTSASALAQFKHPIFEIGGILCVGLSTRCLQLWHLARISILLGELLDSSLADLELLGNQNSVHVVINNTLTNLGDIVLVKLHFTWSIVGQILPTKSLADTTVMV